MAKDTSPARRGDPAGRRTSGRVTPKGPPSSGRYTPPIPREQKVSPRWVPALMFTLLLGGMLVIVCNYVGVLPGIGVIHKAPNNGYLLVGLGMITGGFITATRFH